MTWLLNWWKVQQLYRQLAAIKQAVDARITYDDTGSKEWAYIRKDAKGRGDCQVFAQTYCMDCLYAGLDADTYTYRLPGGQFHAVCIVPGAAGEWVLDCREILPVKR